MTPNSNLANILQFLYPQTKPGIDWVVRQDKENDGPFIAEWNLPDPKPSVEQVMTSEAAWLASRRRPRPEDNIATDLYNWINSLATQAEKNERVIRLLCRIAGYLMRIDPKLAQRQGATISGDEPIP